MTPTPTPTGTGPDILFFGVVRADFCLFCCDASCVTTPTPTPAFDPEGRRIFEVNSSFQFVIVVEGAPGISKTPPGKSTTPIPPTNRTDIQIQSNRDMGMGSGLGSPAVCDTGPASEGGGGIPGIDPPSFAENVPMITDALNDFACRFQVFTATAPCTKVDQTQDPRLITPNAPITTVQFCDQVASVAAFPDGDSVVTVKLRDTAGNLGPTAQIVVRVLTPTPKP